MADYLGDLFCLDAPKTAVVPRYVEAGFFIDVYDWDRLLLDFTSECLLPMRLVLCNGPLPCTLSLEGIGSQNAVLTRAKNGSIACLGSSGCTSMSFSNVKLISESELFPATYSFLEVEGAFLEVKNSTVQGSFSVPDGGSIKAYGGASVQVGEYGLFSLIYALTKPKML